MDYNELLLLVVDTLKACLPIGIIFSLTERLTQFFIGLAFPKK